jgi:aminoglycoside 2''-phosphotransferase
LLGLNHISCSKDFLNSSSLRPHIEQMPSLLCVLRHGDFGSGNILWDGEEDITGIIDFGSLGWGDPGWDIAGLFASYGSAFVKHLVSTYPSVESLLERSPFYHLMFALIDAVFGAEHSEQKILTSGLDTIKLLT